MSVPASKKLVLAGVAALVLATAAVTGASAAERSKAALPPIKENAALHALLPASIQSNGLSIATDPEAPPYEFYAPDNKTIIGADIDLAKGVAAVLGVKANFTALAFPGIIPAIKSGRFDMSISAMGDTPVREQEINFADYSTDGNALIVRKGNPLKIKSMASLCGKRVAVLQGSIMAGLVDTQQKKCGKKITVQTYPNQNTAYLAVKSGRADATMNDAAVAAYFIKTSKDKSLQVLTFHTYGEGYNAIGVAKGNESLLLCVQQAVERLMVSGAYTKILANWGIQAGAIKWPLINDGLRFNQPTG